MLLQDDARKIIDELEGLPTLPSIVSELLERAEDPSTTVGHITDIIRNDPSVNAKILKLVNSAFYGLPRRVSSLHTAVNILGFNAIRNIVLATSVFNTFNGAGVTFNTNGFWIHCIGVGVGCRVLTRRITDAADGSEFVHGLLHDIGKIIMAVHMPETLSTVLERVARKNISFYAAEEEVAPVTHAALGSALAEKWRFPEPLIHAIRHHHHPPQGGAGAAEACVVHVADILARSLQIGWCGDQTVPPVSPAAWQALSLSEQDIGGIMDEMNDGLAAAASFIDLLKD